MTDRWALAWQSRGLFEPDGWNWIHPPAGHFYADPFSLSWKGETYLLFEDYFQGKGEIASCRLDGSELRPALRCEHHLSYPFVIFQGDELFCIPEQHEAGRVSLYRCLEFPHRWREECVLLPDFAGVDPTLLEHQGRYYLWVGEQHRDPRHQVFLFSAEHLTGPWLPHPQQPCLKWDWRGRNGGTIVSCQGRLLRPTQNRTRTYGGSLVFFAIEELSPDHYREREWRTWEPDDGWPYPDGLHHICERDGLTVIDAKRFVEEL